MTLKSIRHRARAQHSSSVPLIFDFLMQGMLRPPVRFEWKGTRLIHRVASPTHGADRIEEISPSEAAWIVFRQALWSHPIFIWQWDCRYELSNSDLYWKLRLTYADVDVKSEGSKKASFRLFALLQAIDALVEQCTG